jgi:hypothetical protein
MQQYILVIGEAKEMTFPEIDFVVSNTAFLDPATRNLSIQDICVSEQIQQWKRTLSVLR